MSKLHVSQLDRGMDLGPAHRNTAINHLVARGTGFHACEEEPPYEDLGPDPKAEGGPEWVPEPEDAPITVEDLFSEPTAPQAYIMDTDRVYCEWCHEARNEDRGTNHTDSDPNYWLFAVTDWQPGHHCHDCGTTDGINCEEGA